MPLPQGVIDFLQENARREGVGEVKAGDDLFKIGALDSFSLVEFVAMLEEQCGLKVPDADVNPANFQTIEAVERYVSAHEG